MGVLGLPGTEDPSQVPPTSISVHDHPTNAGNTEGISLHFSFSSMTFLRGVADIRV